jgi:peptidoglycan/LPS O-acetylase OafA/YrhL
VSGATFRADIQGLRAVAVLLVLAFHLWPDVVTGGYVGVDVFFVISGFLITAHLLQHPPQGTRDLLEFWGRRIRRILPAAFVVLVVTAVASRLVAPETRWAANAGEIVASALYVQNWVLAASSIDYLAAAEPPTTVQHYWSLSVEEQFYLAWPILILAAFWLVRRLRVTSLPIPRLAMLSVVVASLAVSVVATDAEPASAYFITPTRVWELAAGGLVATFPPLTSVRLLGRAAGGVAWLGVIMILVAGLAFTTATPFPGLAALLPVSGTALVILATADGRASPTRLLRIRPIQHLGDTSYSLYLWHWPLITLWPYAVGSIGLLDAVVIVGLTLGLATASKIWVEDAFRFAPSLQPLVPTFRFAAVGMLVLSLLGGSLLVEARVRIDAATASAADVDLDPVDAWVDEPFDEPSPTPASVQPTTSAGPEPTGSPSQFPSQSPIPTPRQHPCRGAASIIYGFDECPQDPAGRMIPDPLAAASDRSDAYRDDCWIHTPFSLRTTCRYGSGNVKVALVGNSHAGQWLPALQALAKRHGWTITTFLASRCNATDATLDLHGGTTGCLDYGRWVMRETRGAKFDLVITSESQAVEATGDDREERLAAAIAGYSTYLERWSAAGTNVLILRDTPYPGRTLNSVPDCLASHRTKQTVCAGTPDSWRPFDPLYEAATASRLPGITTLDTTRFLCTPTACPAVIGSVIVYFDASHMTETYARSIAPYIEAEILSALASGAGQ